MKFTSDRQRKAMFAKLNRFSDGSSRRNVAVIIGSFKEGGIDELAKILYDDPKINAKNVAALDGNTKGYSEIYVECPDEKTTEMLARSVQMISSPVRGTVMDSSFDDVVSDPTFMMMGGRKIGNPKDKIVEEKKGIYWRDADESSEDYVSKGDYIDERPRNKYRFSKKRDKGYTATIDGYECDYCGDEFSTKAAASIHSSICNEKDDDSINYDDDNAPLDSFFSNDDGTI